MTIFYPKKYKGNQIFKDDLNVLYYDDILILYNDGFIDTFSLIISHCDNSEKLNYEIYYDDSKHTMTTNIDCRYPSNNIKQLLNWFSGMEEHITTS